MKQNCILNFLYWIFLLDFCFYACSSLYILCYSRELRERKTLALKKGGNVEKMKETSLFALLPFSLPSFLPSYLLFLQRNSYPSLPYYYISPPFLPLDVLTGKRLSISAAINMSGGFARGKEKKRRFFLFSSVLLWEMQCHGWDGVWMGETLCRLRRILERMARRMFALLQCPPFLRPAKCYFSYCTV